MTLPGMGLGRQEAFLAARGDCRIPVNSSKFFLLPHAVSLWERRQSRGGAGWDSERISPLGAVTPLQRGILAGPSGAAAEANQSRNDPDV